MALLGVCLWTSACRNPFNEVSVSVDMVTAAVTTALTARLSTPSTSGPGAGKAASAQASAQVSRDLRRRMRLISTQRCLAASAEAHTNNASSLLPTSSISEGLTCLGLTCTVVGMDQDSTGSGLQKELHTTGSCDNVTFTCVC